MDDFNPVPWIGGGGAGLVLVLLFRWLNVIISERVLSSKENRDRRKDDHDWFEESIKSRDGWIDRLKHDLGELRKEYDGQKVIYEADAAHFRERIDQAEQRERVCQARLSDVEREVETLRNLLKVDER